MLTIVLRWITTLGQIASGDLRVVAPGLRVNYKVSLLYSAELIRLYDIRDDCKHQMSISQTLPKN
jgi:hypothetical protein